MYVFTSPDNGVSLVKFWLDDPGMTGPETQLEKRGPFDFAGTNKNVAHPFDTTQLLDGNHTITAQLHLAGGSVLVLNATFLVMNDQGPGLIVTPNSILMTSGEGGADVDSATVTTSDALPATIAIFEETDWLTVEADQLNTPATLTLTADAGTLAPGTYEADVSVTTENHLDATLHVSFEVRAPADQIHLAWVESPATTLTMVWRTYDAATPSQVEYRLLGEADWLSETGNLRPSGTTGKLHQTTVRNLTPDATYEYRVRGDGGTWSDIYQTRTAPPPGPADFDVIYFADTGLIGRLDGLATGTEQAVNEIAALNPTLILAGGDYAYFNTDTRYGTLENTIDVWFNQVQPFAARSPMMPTYGNHEVKLGEGFEPWAARFPTPTGFDGRRNYSFDVADVHFISILAVDDGTGLSAATLQWIQQDIFNAQQLGATWVIPFMHVSPFADGGNHHSNTALRAQLGPIFEQFNIKVAISSHDQAYERTWPLVDVPATNSPTSISLDCYDSTDGVTWVKFSPAGKLSNKNSSFSSFANNPPPSWTAVRNNTMHNFGRLTFGAVGTLRVEAIGVVGDGSPPVILDSFEYRLSDDCPQSLVFTEQSQVYSLTTDQVFNGSVGLTTTNGAAASVTVNDDADWLTVVPELGEAPTVLNLTIDTTGLAVGGYDATVDATATGFAPDSMMIHLEVGSDNFTIAYSKSSNRSAPIPLNGAAVDGDIYVFTTPNESVDRVRFYLNDPNRTGSPFKTENNAPFDLRGGSVSTANPFNTNSLTDGLNTITAELFLLAGGSEIIHADFVVTNNPTATALFFNTSSADFLLFEDQQDAQIVGLNTSDGSPVTYTLLGDATWLTINADSTATPANLTLNVDTTGITPGAHSVLLEASAEGYDPATLTINLTVLSSEGGSGFDLLLSNAPDRSNAVSLDGATLIGNVYIFSLPEEGVDEVKFYIDNPAMVGSPFQREGSAPFDLAGTFKNAARDAKPFDSAQLANGPHVITARMQLSVGGEQIVHANVNVAN
mgnify:CR=1 FL=1